MSRLIITVSLVIVYALISSCNDGNNNIPTKPPDIGDTFDFRLTDFYPAWSPDGKTIAYVHGDTTLDKTGLYLIDMSGHNKRILYSSSSASTPTWSPDGKWIAFSMYAQIYKIKTTGDSLIQLTYEGRNFFPSWSPDGEWIAYDSNVNDSKGANVIWKMRSDGKGKKDISEHGVGEWRMPNWSPNGKSIIHQRYVGMGTPEIALMDSSGKNPVRLTFDNRDDRYPKFSFDGNKIVFTSQSYASVPQIWVMDADGKNQKQLTATQGYSCDWSPDGKLIVYTDSRAVNGRLWIMQNDGTNEKQLTY